MFYCLLAGAWLPVLIRTAFVSLFQLLFLTFSRHPTFLITCMQCRIMTVWILFHYGQKEGKQAKVIRKKTLISSSTGNKIINGFYLTNSHECFSVFMLLEFSSALSIDSSSLLKFSLLVPSLLQHSDFFSYLFDCLPFFLFSFSRFILFCMPVK